MDISFKEQLPNKINSDQLQAELAVLVTPPAKIANSIVYNSLTLEALEIIVHAPDDIDLAAVEQVIKNHNPQKKDSEVVEDRKKSAFDEQLIASSVYQSLVARIGALEK